GRSAQSVFNKLLEEFNVSASVFISSPGGHPVYKILDVYNNTSIFMELYDNSNAGYAWTIGFYIGPSNAQSSVDLSAKFKIRFDN
ncbi:MAG: hypothetical protein KDC54_16725, partial [Lewinella sp.]|nr:hypothetical protein [Lewinella sp.]